MPEHDDERIPPTQSHGDLDPPKRRPPTAIGAATPEDEPRRPAELNDLARFRTRTRTFPLHVGIARTVRKLVRRLVGAGSR